MNAPELIMDHEENKTQAAGLLGYYEAIEQASQNMLEAARAGDWDSVMRLESACAVLIAQLKYAAADRPLQTEEVTLKGRIMKRILVNDAEIRHLAEPWINDLSNITGSKDGDAVH